MEASVETRAEKDAEAAVRAGRGPELERAAAGPGVLPNLIVVGAQKCGTSGLHSYLATHPEISMSSPKELNFFIAERNWPLGVDWYRRHFDPRKKVRGESSPNYTAYPHHMDVPERMHSLVPDARLIYLVRDPLNRIAAHWVHNYAKRREKGDLATTLMHPNTTYVIRSQYFMQLQQFLKHYPRERTLVLEQEDLRRRRAETLREVFAFLGVDPDFQHPSFQRERHRSARKQRATRMGLALERLLGRVGRGRIPKGYVFGLEEMLLLRRPIERPNVRDTLTPEVLRVLHEDAERLREFTGRGFEHWSL